MGSHRADRRQNARGAAPTGGHVGVKRAREKDGGVRRDGGGEATEGHWATRLAAQGELELLRAAQVLCDDLQCMLTRPLRLDLDGVGLARTRDQRALPRGEAEGCGRQRGGRELGVGGRSLWPRDADQWMAGRRAFAGIRERGRGSVRQATTRRATRAPSMKSSIPCRSWIFHRPSNSPSFPPAPRSCPSGRENSGSRERPSTSPLEASATAPCRARSHTGNTSQNHENAERRATIRATKAIDDHICAALGCARNPPQREAFRSRFDDAWCATLLCAVKIPR